MLASLPMAAPTVFIQTNGKQLLGAKLAAYAIQRALKQPSSVRVQTINVDEIDAFRGFVGKSFRRGKETRVFTLDDLQSFTLTRFMPPELMGYEGRAVVIDPDVFAQTDISELFTMDLGGRAIAACRKASAWDTSVMVLDCEKLRHWRLESLLSRLEDGSLDYNVLMRMEAETSIMELSRDWNSLDRLDASTKLLHTTNRLTQPWKAGLPIDFTRNRLPPLFSFLPREPIWKLLGKYPSRYQRHPDERVEKYFFSLVRDALHDKVIDKPFLDLEIQAKHVRADLHQHL